MSASPAYPDPIADVARRQHGLFSVGQARSLRLNPTTIDRRLETGRYERLHPGVYRVAGAPDSREARYMAAVLAVSTAQDPAVLSHSSAAHLWRFGVRPDEMIHVVSETHHPGRLDGVKPHRTKALPVHHRTERDGIPVTSPERTLCELASCVGYTTLRKAVANAMRRNLVTAADLAATMYELGRIRGKTQLRMILAEVTPLERDAREGIESLFLRVMTWAGFPPSAMNHPTRDAAGDRRLLDAVYLPEDYDLHEPVWIELDSEAFHTATLDVIDDRRREDSLVAAGWPRPLRYTWTDLLERPDQVVDEIRTALTQRRVAAGPTIAG